MCSIALGNPLGSPAQAETAPPSIQPAYLFAFDGVNAAIAPVSKKQGRFTLTVPISRGNQLVSWFTDRPVRDAGHMPMDFFVSLWTKTDSDGFAADPPNVAISFGSRTVIATMTAPAIITNKDGGKALRTTMTLVTGKALTTLVDSGISIAAIAKRASGNAYPTGITLPTVSVFVDDSSGTVCSGWAACCQTANSVPGGSCSITRK